MKYAIIIMQKSTGQMFLKGFTNTPISEQTEIVKRYTVPLEEVTGLYLSIPILTDEGQIFFKEKQQELV